MKYIEMNGKNEETAKVDFVDHEDIACECCNTTCTWEDVNIDTKGNYLCDDCYCDTF